MPTKTIVRRVVVNNASDTIAGCLNGQPVLVELQADDCGYTRSVPVRVLKLVAGQPTPIDTSSWDSAAWAELSVQACPEAGGIASCEVKYAIVQEGHAVTVPAGARHLTVTTPCDGSATCTGLSTVDTTVVADGSTVAAPTTVITASSLIEQPYEAVLSNPVTITADIGTTEVSWLEC